MLPNAVVVGPCAGEGVLAYGVDRMLRMAALRRHILQLIGVVRILVALPTGVALPARLPRGWRFVGCARSGFFELFRVHFQT